MRGSIIYQVNELFNQVKEFGKSKHQAKIEFREKAKEIGINGALKNYTERYGVFSMRTADTYRVTWRECLQYAKDNFKVKDIEKVNGEIIRAFILDKLEETKNRNTIDKISSALIKMGVALDRLHSFNMDSEARLQELESVKTGKAEFNPASENLGAVDHFRKAINEVKSEEKGLYRPEQARAYKNYMNVAEHLQSEKHQVAVKLIEELGMRAHELSLIKPGQLTDNKTLRYISKGGQLNNREISPELAGKLRGYFEKEGKFEVNKRDFRADIKQACAETGEKYNAIHGFRWSVAQDLMYDSICEGKTYAESLGIVSEFLTHHRLFITKHYLQK
jgi:integrase